MTLPLPFSMHDNEPMMLRLGRPLRLVPRIEVPVSDDPPTPVEDYDAWFTVTPPTGVEIVSIEIRADTTPLQRAVHALVKPLAKEIKGSIGKDFFNIAFGKPAIEDNVVMDPYTGELKRTGGYVVGDEVGDAAAYAFTQLGSPADGRLRLAARREQTATEYAQERLVKDMREHWSTLDARSDWRSTGRPRPTMECRQLKFSELRDAMLFTTPRYPNASMRKVAPTFASLVDGRIRTGFGLTACEYVSGEYIMEPDDMVVVTVDATVAGAYQYWRAQAEL